MAVNLSKYFVGISAKRLSEVEINPSSSNQHEFNGINEFKGILGSDRKTFNGKLIYLSDEREKSFEVEGFLTWYDARQKHPTRSEYRLYYPFQEMIDQAAVGDLIIIARTIHDQLLLLLTQAGSTSEQQLLWFFKLSEVQNKFIVKDLTNEHEDLGYSGEYIYTALGVEIEEEATDYLKQMLEQYDNKFPSTSIFSSYARSTLSDISSLEDPDEALLKWMQREELLFKTLEKHIVQGKLEKGFGNDGSEVEDFINFSLSVQNRRKSRAGYAFENHLSIVFNQNGIKYSNGKVTELNKKPDFIFPGITEYHNNSFNTSLLTMLGVKTSSKDRWRQVLSEAAKIPHKHLLTLEPGISKNQTDEMQSENLQLVIPLGIQNSYSRDQKKSLLSLREFISIVKERQTKQA